MGSISNISSSLLQQSLFPTTGLSGNASTNSTSAVSGASDNNQLSPLAKALGELQALQQTDPAKYKDVTGQIATKLQGAAQADTAAGNIAGATQLTQLAADFTTASATGQLPNLQDLAKSVGGGGHHHHHGHGGAQKADQDSDTTPAANQLQSAYQNNSIQSGSSESGSGQASSTKPLAIILNTLAA